MFLVPFCLSLKIYDVIQRVFQKLPTVQFSLVVKGLVYWVVKNIFQEFVVLTVFFQAGAIVKIPFI